MASSAGKVKHTNRLAEETSPYLLQHAHNPVDWHPWGKGAFERAQRVNKPIFLSVGYSTCYWCHVMERQSFESEQIAEEMNRRFINIKVDREERPDVDQLYMTAVQVLTRHGGWPMSVFLTPDLKPFYGGTYFPPTDQHGRPGFLTLLRAIDGAYQERPEDVRKTTEQLMEILLQLAEPQPPKAPFTIDWNFINDQIDRSTIDYDPAYGGFGAAPKFPRQTLLELLLVYVQHAPDSDDDGSVAARKLRILSQLRHTLDAMAAGGIRDHLGGGFHRYSTDAQWLVPHFEIMLYDNAMLGWVYTEAYRQTREPMYAKVAHGIFDFIIREMTSPEGAFYTAFDAEVDAREGLTYLWTREEVESVLRGEGHVTEYQVEEASPIPRHVVVPERFAEEEIELFVRIYGLDRGPNFADPHHGSGRPDRSILYLPEPLEKSAERLGITLEELEAKLGPMRQKLYEVRRTRKQPLLDTKIITSWNALMIRAFAHAGRVLKEAGYSAAAKRAAEFLLQQHMKPDGNLWRTSREGRTRHDGFLEDYAFLVDALLDLSDESEEQHWRARASALAQRMIELFGDREHGGFYFTAAGAEDMIIRQKVATDSPLPSGNAVAARALPRLEQTDLARDTIMAFAQPLESSAESMSALLESAIFYLQSEEPIGISPGPWRGAGEERPLSPEQMAAGVVSIEGAWVSPRELHVHVGIAQGFHVNAHEAGQGLVPTHLTVDPAAAVESVEYPPGEEQRFAFSNETLRVYEGAATIAVRFNRAMDGASPLRMCLSYQACNDDGCLPAVRKQFEVNAP